MDSDFTEPGDSVAVDEVIAQIETDKVLMRSFPNLFFTIVSENKFWG